MSTILCIETSTSVCSVAIGHDGEVDAFVEENQDNSHSQKLTNFIQSVLDEASVSMKELDAISVSDGPGSYTGLRIGASTAKGLCFALDKPLISIPTLQAMAWGALHQHEFSGTRDSSLASKMNSAKYLLCPMIDARRMEVYCTVYNEQLQEVKSLSADVIESNSFAELLRDHMVYFFGDGALKCKELLSNYPHADFSISLLPSARFMMKLAQDKLTGHHTENMALYEPNYFKDFRAGVKKAD